MISQVFQKQLSADLNRFRFLYTSHTCQIVADTFITTQFHEFFECIFWRVFAICPECAAAHVQKRVFTQHKH